MTWYDVDADHIEVVAVAPPSSHAPLTPNAVGTNALDSSTVDKAISNVRRKDDDRAMVKAV